MTKKPETDTSTSYFYMPVNGFCFHMLIESNILFRVWKRCLGSPRIGRRLVSGSHEVFFKARHRNTPSDTTPDTPSKLDDMEPSIATSHNAQ